MKPCINFVVAAAALLVTIPCHAVTIEPGLAVQNVLPITSPDGLDTYSTMPLPEGPWMVAYTSAKPANDGKNTFRFTALFQSENGRLTQGAEYRTKVLGQGNKWLDEPCKVTAPLYKNDFGTSIWRQKCLVVNEGPYLQNTNDVSLKTLDLLTSRGIKPELNAINITYTRYGDDGKFTVVRLYIMPNAYGFDIPVYNVRSASPWAAHNITSDPEKGKFVEAVKAYAESIVADLDQAYETGSATKPLRPFTYSRVASNRPIGSPALITPAPSPASSPTSPGPVVKGKSVEDRLEMLKSLFEQNLLTKDEYNAKKKTILVDL